MEASNFIFCICIIIINVVCVHTMILIGFIHSSNDLTHIRKIALFFPPLFVTYVSHKQWMWNFGFLCFFFAFIFMHIHIHFYIRIWATIKRFIAIILITSITVKFYYFAFKWHYVVSLSLTLHLNVCIYAFLLSEAMCSSDIFDFPFFPSVQHHWWCCCCCCCRFGFIPFLFG